MAEAENPKAVLGDNGRIRAFVERIEKLEDEKSNIGLDIKEVYAEAKGGGYDTKILKKLVAIRKMDRDKYREEQEMLRLYGEALGVFA